MQTIGMNSSSHENPMWYVQKKSSILNKIRLNLTNDLIHPIQIVDTGREQSLCELLNYATRVCCFCDCVDVNCYNGGVVAVGGIVLLKKGKKEAKIKT